MATVDTRLGASTHFANVLGQLGDRGRKSVSGATPVEADAAWDQVMLLVHGDGAPDEVVATDSSQFARVPAITGGVTVTDVGAPIGTGALTNSTTPSNVIYPSSEDFRIPLEFTFEFTITPTSFAVQSYFMAASAVQYWAVGATGILTFVGLSAGPSTQLALNTTARIALSRNAAGTMRLFKDGAVVSTATTTTLQSVNQSLGLFGVPGRTDLQSFVGRLEEIRYTKGLCRYDGSSYDVDPGPFPDGA